jgi:glutaredoxin
MLSFFRNLRARQSSNCLHWVVYTRRNCHLCEDALRHLRKEQSQHGFRLEIIDVDSDQSLAANFGEMVPVIAVNGQIRLWGNINPVLLRRLLRGEAQRKVKG